MLTYTGNRIIPDEIGGDINAIGFEVRGPDDGRDRLPFSLSPILSSTLPLLARSAARLSVERMREHLLIVRSIASMQFAENVSQI